MVISSESNNEELWLTGIMTMAIYHLLGLLINEMNPLVDIQKTMEHHHFSWVNPL